MSNSKYTDLFIDFDDTLYDTYGNSNIALRELFHELHFEQYGVDEQLFYEAYWRANVDLWTKYSKGEITRDILIPARFSVPLNEAASPLPSTKREGVRPCRDVFTKEFCIKVSDRFLELCSNKPGVVDGAHELMDYLKANGYRMHLCSNGFHEVQYKKLRSCGLYDYFHTIILSEDAGANKPQLQFFEFAKKASRCVPETTLMIGDNYNTDILGAMAAGLDTMLFNHWDPTFEPPTKPTFCVNTLKEISRYL